MTTLPPAQPGADQPPPVVYPADVAAHGYVQHPNYSSQQPYVPLTQPYPVVQQAYPPAEQAYPAAQQGSPLAPQPAPQSLPEAPQAVQPAPHDMTLPPMPSFPNGGQGSAFRPGTGLQARVRGNWMWAILLFGFPLLLIPVGIVILIAANAYYYGH